MTLSVRERAIIDFERSWWVDRASPAGTTKQDSIRSRLQMSPTRYYVLLEQLVDSPEAAEYDPLVIRRLQRRRTARRRALFTTAELPGEASATLSPEARAAIALLAEAPDRTGVLSDFDGTLAPIVADPERSEADPRSLAALRLLAGAFATVAVVSGRPASFVAARLDLAGHPAPIRVLGLYGLEEADSRGVVTLHPSVSAWSRVVARVASEARAALPRGVLVEDKGATLALHWRARPDAEGAILAFAEHAARLEGLELSRGKMVAELLPPIGTDKGSAVRQLASTLGAACFIGDDLGDVPAFEELARLGSPAGAGAGGAGAGGAGDGGRSSFTALRIAVAGGEAPPELMEQADLGLEGTAGVAEFLAELARVVGRG